MRSEPVWTTSQNEWFLGTSQKIRPGQYSMRPNPVDRTGWTSLTHIRTASHHPPPSSSAILPYKFAMRQV